MIIGIAIVGYVVGWAGSPLVLGYGHSDLDLFFWPSVQLAAHGHALSIYTSQAHLDYPNANGPLGLLPLIPIALVGNAMGWASQLPLVAAASDAVAAVFMVLLTWQAMRLIGAPRRNIRLLAIAVTLLLTPTLMTSLGDYGHPEQPLELWLILLAAGAALRGRPALSGVGVGLAFLTRTTAVLYAIPFVLLLLDTRRLRQSATFVGATVCTVAIGLAPFAIADASALLHSLWTYRADLPIAGGSLWVVARGGPLAGVVQHSDGYVVGLTAIALCGVIAWRHRGARMTAATLFGALTVAALCFPMLAKTTLSYYYIEPYVFSVVWWLARPGSAINWRIAVPLAITGLSMLARFTSNQLFTDGDQAVGIAASAVAAASSLLVVGDLVVRGDHGKKAQSVTAQPPAEAELAVS